MGLPREGVLGGGPDSLLTSQELHRGSSLSPPRRGAELLRAEASLCLCWEGGQDQALHPRSGEGSPGCTPGLRRRAGQQP